MSNNAFLNSLEISNFRAFDHLKIEKLGRINLIVGKNNVGKTSLLEAIRLYASPSHATIWEILSSREEGVYPEYSNSNGSMPDKKLKIVRHLFHGRPDLLLVPKDEHVSCRIKGTPHKSITNHGVILSFSWQFNSNIHTDSTYKSLIENFGGPMLYIGMNDLEIGIDMFHMNPSPMANQQALTQNSTRHIFVPAHGLSTQESDQLWSQIALTDMENDVLRALKIILPEIEQIGIVSKPERNMDRTVIARLNNYSEPVPLKSMGEGVNRVFHILLALVNARDGFLLVDEIGSGLHYSVQLKLWRLFFEVAEKSNVQVFATTHSNDCIDAFQAASKASPELGMLIRLERRNGTIVPIPYDEEILESAQTYQIEVR